MPHTALTRHHTKPFPNLLTMTKNQNKKYSLLDDEDALRLTHQFDEDFGNWRKNFQKLKESSSSSSHNIGGLLEVGGGGVGGSSFGFSWPFSNARDEPHSRQPAEFPFGALDGSEDEQPGLRVVGLDRDRESLGKFQVVCSNQLREMKH